MKSQEIIRNQQIILAKFLQIIFSRHHQITTQMFQKVLGYLFSSPYRQKNMFVLKQGTILVKYGIQRKISDATDIYNLGKQDYLLHPINSETISVSRAYSIKQGSQIILTTQNQTQRLRISKIWNKPPTRTQKKILTYCGRFRQFLMGKHLMTKTMQLNNQNRQFLFENDLQRQQFFVHYKNIEQNEPNYCSFDVLDSYMTLVQQNYVEIEFQSNDFYQRNEKYYKVVSEELAKQVEILKGVRIQFNQYQKKWIFRGKGLILWINGNSIGRGKQVVRSWDGRVEVTEGRIIRKAIEMIGIHQTYEIQLKQAEQ